MFIVLDTTKEPYEAFLFGSLDAATQFAEDKMKENGKKELTFAQFIEYWKYHKEGK